VARDLRAHGESMTSDAFSFAAAVDDVVALFDELDLHRIGLVGLSLGGNIAQEIVFRDPRGASTASGQRVSRAVPAAVRH
jgi:pimeloyl-ACP methyl ester carboxylesterase